MTIGDRIKQCRDALGISAETLADKVGISRSTMFRYENGFIQKIPVKTLSSIASALHTTSAYLSGEEAITFPRNDDPIVDNTLYVIRRTGARKKYILSDGQTDLIEGMLEQMPRATSPINHGEVKLSKNPLTYGAIAAEGGKENRSPKKKPKTT